MMFRLSKNHWYPGFCSKKGVGSWRSVTSTLWSTTGLMGMRNRKTDSIEPSPNRGKSHLSFSWLIVPNRNPAKQVFVRSPHHRQWMFRIGRLFLSILSFTLPLLLVHHPSSFPSILPSYLWMYNRGNMSRESLTERKNVCFDKNQPHFCIKTGVNPVQFQPLFSRLV